MGMRALYALIAERFGKPKAARKRPTAKRAVTKR
jgi:hypothetical protein